jgi:transglycosylase-like protein
VKRPLAAVAAATMVALGLSTDAAQAPQSERAGADELRHQLRKERQRHQRQLVGLRLAVMRNCCNAPTPALAVIAACESGGRPWALSPGGTFRGKYQFAWSTWRGMGGRGDPAAAPEPEQDYRAWLLYQLRGSQPWPVCGRGW